MRSSVDLPLPFSPSRPVGRPAGTTRLMSVRTRRPGKEKEIPSARRCRAGSPEAARAPAADGAAARRAPDDAEARAADGVVVRGCAGMDQLLDAHGGAQGRWSAGLITGACGHRRSTAAAGP